MATCFRADGARVVRLGFWPRHVHHYLTDATHRHAELVRLIQRFAKAVAPCVQCTSMALRQGPAVDQAESGLLGEWLELYFKVPTAWAHVCREGSKRRLFRQNVAVAAGDGRTLSIIVGRASGELSQQLRVQLRRAGFGVAPAV